MLVPSLTTPSSAQPAKSAATATDPTNATGASHRIALSMHRAPAKCESLVAPGCHRNNDTTGFDAPPAAPRQRQKKRSVAAVANRGDPAARPVAIPVAPAVVA